MKILDKYVAKNFLYGYCITLFVMLGMFLTIDLFMNLDEFAELVGKENSVTGEELTLQDVVMNVVRFYSVRCSLWYKDMAGMIIVIAAVFSLARMTRNNELVAVMASGTSLKRILAPILFLSLVLTGLMVFDQEFVIPKYAYELTRDHDELTNEGVYSIWFVGDDEGSLFCCHQYEEATQTLTGVLIILREQVQVQEDIHRVIGKIKAVSAVYDEEQGGWMLNEGELMYLHSGELEDTSASLPQSISFYPSTLTARDIPIRKREGYKALLSLRQLTELEKNTGVRKTDLTELALQKHTRITDPIINLIMLMVALPVLVCRDPKTMKTAIMVSFLTTTTCFVVVFICKLLATEAVFGQPRPALWAWVPIAVFFPIAMIEIDSMRT